MSCKGTQEFWLERPGFNEIAATESAKYKVDLVTEQCETKGASGPAGNSIWKRNDKLCYLTGLFIEKKMIKVIGPHTIPRGSLYDCTILNVRATTDDESHDDTRTVIIC